jgi:hypothetical protein
MSDTLRNPLGQWLLEVLETEPPSADIGAFGVGVAETDEGYRAYLFGAESFDEDEDWIWEPAYKPVSRELPIPESSFRFVGWEDCLINLLSSLSVALTTPPLAASPIGKAAVVAVGIEDGVLYRVR